MVENERVYLIDFKTIGAYVFKLKFGRSPVMDGAIHQEMQLGTYGLAVKEMFGRLDGMYLMYYCKDTSVMKDKQVPLTYLNKAEIIRLTVTNSLCLLFPITLVSSTSAILQTTFIISPIVISFLIINNGF